MHRRWVEARNTNLRYRDELDWDGHFPMLAVPDADVAELRSAFEAMRA